MKRIMFFAVGLTLAALASGPATAQRRGVMPGTPATGCRGASPHLGGLNPGMSLSAPTTTPLQAQMQNNYASQLQGAQRDMLQRNPSGTTRQELEIGHTLNGFTPR